jgi:opacity protein-like surface antigen
VASGSNVGDSLEQPPGAPAVISPAPIEVTNQDAAAAENYTTWNTMASLSHQLNRRLAATLSYDYSSFSSPSHVRDMHYSHAAGYMSLEVGKGLAVRLGYAFTAAEYANGTIPGARNSNIIAGLDYSRALSVSLSRKTSLSFGVGTSIVSDVPLQEGAQSNQHFFVTGHATLNREIGRTWNAAVMFDQSVNFVYALQEPALTDTLSGSFGGLISRKVQFHSSVGAAQGSAITTSRGSHYRTYFAGTGLQFAVSRSMALGINYSFTRYSFDDGINLPFNLSRNESRHSVMATFSFFDSLFNRTRRPDATR